MDNNRFTGLKMNICTCFILLAFVSCDSFRKEAEPDNESQNNYAVMVRLCLEDNKISTEWKKALTRRHSKQFLDSLSQVKRPLTDEENKWYELITSRAEYWNQLKDSLRVPFGDIYINDSTYVFLGYLGSNDGFTYQYQTVCFDLTALQKTYGSANDPVNTNRIDRLFAHEYTHLLSKEWARQNELKLNNYQDSILWECIYEGIGMYRSMSARWFPVGDSLSEISARTFETLYPTFSERLTTIMTAEQLSDSDKERLHKRLSHGPMTQKWGALPVGVWLAMEAKGNDMNLRKWVEKGPDAIIPLGSKYLTGESKIRFDSVFGETQAEKR